MSGDDAAPLIVTALLPRALHSRLTALRRAHFPPERNYLAAHVTLFHALPPTARGEAARLLSTMAAGTAPVAGRIEGLMSLGRGTAIRLSSPAMLALRERIAAHFHGSLSAQDGHAPRLHVTIQNKVTPEAARALQAELAGSIAQEDFAFRGLALHAYRGGPWETLGEYAFRAAP